MQQNNKPINVSPDKLAFLDFLENVRMANYPTNVTALGTITIQQTLRNNLRREGVAALKHDLELIYGNWFDIVETKEGIVIVIENEPNELTISWEIKNTIKALDYKPFDEADKWDEAQASNEAKKNAREQEKEAKAILLAEKRAKKLAELERKELQKAKSSADKFDGEVVERK